VSEGINNVAVNAGISRSAIGKTPITHGGILAACCASLGTDSDTAIFAIFHRTT